MPWRALVGKFAFLLLMLPATLFSGAVGAEVLDELTVFQERADAVVRITFGARIQYLRHVIVGDNLLEIYFQILSAEGVTVTETRRIAPSATFPGVEVTYPLQPRFQPQKLTVRFTSTVTLRVRPGGNRAIDLIIPDGARLLARAPASRRRSRAGAGIRNAVRDPAGVVPHARGNAPRRADPKPVFEFRRIYFRGAARRQNRVPTSSSGTSGQRRRRSGSIACSFSATRSPRSSTSASCRRILPGPR